MGSQFSCSLCSISKAGNGENNELTHSTNTNWDDISLEESKKSEKNNAKGTISDNKKPV